MNAKGLAVLQHIIARFGPSSVQQVIFAEDSKVVKDYSGEIKILCQECGIPVSDRRIHIESKTPVLRIAIGWRWILPEAFPLIIIHDSLLPKYRGYSPVVSALLNREPLLGATALLGDAEFDAGPILEQESFKVDYPAKINDVIDRLATVYQSLVEKIFRRIENGNLEGSSQDLSQVTFSLWRDDEDYLIDWSKSAEEISLFIDCVGTPYLGAATRLDRELVRIMDAEVLPDVKIENRTPGKFIFLRDGFPVIVCGTGLLKVKEMNLDSSKESMLPLKKYRLRFY